jgi:nitrite transporter NirC
VERDHPKLDCLLTGNLMGAIFFAFLIKFSGLLGSLENSQLLMTVASTKMSAPFMELFFRAILCNWVVCLAVWLPLHVKGDGAKITVMMLLVFAFVASGFEHSVANMVTFAIALSVPHPDAVTILGAIHNLIPVTIGNIIGGGLFVGGLYVYLSLDSNAKRNLKMKNVIDSSFYKKIKA